MRLVLRWLGVWLLALALVLAVIDGTRSLAANALVLTPLIETWQQLGAGSLAATREFFASRFFSLVLAPAFEGLLVLPAFLVTAVPGLVLLVVARPRRRVTYLLEDRI